MTSPITTSTPTSHATGAQRGGLPGSPNPDFRAAVLKDLYKAGGAHGIDAALERGQARVLGLAFLIFFGGILGGISLSLNGLWPWTQSKRTVVSYHAPEGALPGWLKKNDKDETIIAPGTRFEVKTANGTLTPAVLDKDAPRNLDKYQVRVFVDRYRIGVLELDLDPKTVTVHPDGVTAYVGTTPETLPVYRAWEHAWNNAKLAKLVPTRFVMGFGLFMGIVALILPGALVPFYRFWMRWVTAPLGWFNTRLILSIVFFLFLTPMAVFARVMGKGRLELKPRPEGGSYWKKRAKQRERNHFERTF